ncbi:MAG: hypothetical protein BV456_00585 [Thermoplasmata archaeon M8B2D]|nr:MAG: hypothetical protein BV456_00585 [Thermoplasmata archaeon M8B2D]
MKQLNIVIGFKIKNDDNNGTEWDVYDIRHGWYNQNDFGTVDGMFDDHDKAVRQVVWLNKL